MGLSCFFILLFIGLLGLPVMAVVIVGFSLPGVFVFFMGFDGPVKTFLCRIKFLFTLQSKIQKNKNKNCLTKRKLKAIEG